MYTLARRNPQMPKVDDSSTINLEFRTPKMLRQKIGKWYASKTLAAVLSLDEALKMRAKIPGSFVVELD